MTTPKNMIVIGSPDTYGFSDMAHLLSHECFGLRLGIERLIRLTFRAYYPLIALVLILGRPVLVAVLADTKVHATSAVYYFKRGCRYIALIN